MNTERLPQTCPRCHAPIPAEAPQGLCPKCLMAGAAVPTDPGSAPSREGSQPPSLASVAAAFPQLEIIELIGQGGMGVVYKARQPQLDRFVALKLLAPERVTDARFAERFQQEAQALARLSHPNIVTIHDFGFAQAPSIEPRAPGGFYFLLMEFVDGVNLRQAMKAGRFTPEQALAIVPPVCEALQYAHDRGIVHRDIKPENLLLDKDGRIKIADFGIARMLGGNGHPLTPSLSPSGGEGARRAGEGDAATRHAVIGTPQYMAPEQRDAPQKTDHRADIYSLGVVLYELLTGEPPRGKLEPPSRRVQIDVRLDEIVLRALEVKPELRYQTAAEFRTQVETITSSPATLAPSSGASHAAAGRRCVCYLSTPERMRNCFPSAAAQVFHCKGELQLTPEALTFVSPWQTRIIIPLTDIKDLSIGQFQMWTTPWVMQYERVSFLSVTFDADARGQTVLLTPVPGGQTSAQQINERIGDWFEAIQNAVTARTGSAPPGTNPRDVSISAEPAWNKKGVPLLFVFLIAAGLVVTRLRSVLDSSPQPLDLVLVIVMGLLLMGLLWFAAGFLKANSALKRGDLDAVTTNEPPENPALFRKAGTQQRIDAPQTPPDHEAGAESRTQSGTLASLRGSGQREGTRSTSEPASAATPQVLVMFATVVTVLYALVIGGLALRHLGLDSVAGLLLLLVIVVLLWPMARERWHQGGGGNVMMSPGGLSLLGWLAFVLALPVIGFAVFFVAAMSMESGGWNPAPAEAIIVPLTWLGAILLPLSSRILFRAPATAPPVPSVPNRAANVATVFLGIVLLFGGLMLPVIISTNRTSAARLQTQARFQQTVALQRPWQDAQQRRFEAQTALSRWQADTSLLSEADAIAARKPEEARLTAELQAAQQLVERLEREMNGLNRAATTDTTPPPPAAWRLLVIGPLVAFAGLFLIVGGRRRPNHARRVGAGKIIALGCLGVLLTLAALLISYLFVSFRPVERNAGSAAFVRVTLSNLRLEDDAFSFNYTAQPGRDWDLWLVTIVLERQPNGDHRLGGERTRILSRTADLVRVTLDGIAWDEEARGRARAALGPGEGRTETLKPGRGVGLLSFETAAGQQVSVTLELRPKMLPTTEPAFQLYFHDPRVIANSNTIEVRVRCDMQVEPEGYDLVAETVGVHLRELRTDGTVVADYATQTSSGPGTVTVVLTNRGGGVLSIGLPGFKESMSPTEAGLRSDLLHQAWLVSAVHPLPLFEFPREVNGVRPRVTLRLVSRPPAGKADSRGAGTDALTGHLASGVPPSTPASGKASNPGLVSVEALEQARADLKRAEAMYKAGRVGQLEVLDARYHLKWLEAMRAGDTVAAAQSKVDLARERLKIIELLATNGRLSAGEVAKANRELAEREAELRIAAPTAAGSTKTNGVPPVKRADVSLEPQLRELYRILAKLRVDCAEDHPDVVAMKARIAKVEESLAKGENIKLAELRGQLAALLAERSPDPLAVKKMRARITALEASESKWEGPKSTLITKDGTRVEATEMDVDQASGRFTARGNITMAFPPGSLAGLLLSTPRLSYQDFDQTRGAGWRFLADQRRFTDAAQLIESYLAKRADLQIFERANLHFHAAQCLAFEGTPASIKAALAHLTQARLNPEPPNSPVRWNDYVAATEAFLKNDLNALKAARARVAQGPSMDGEVANLSVVDRLIANFGRPYGEAYADKSARGF